MSSFAQTKWFVQTRLDYDEAACKRWDNIWQVIVLGHLSFKYLIWIKTGKGKSTRGPPLDSSSSNVGGGYGRVTLGFI